MYRVVRGFYIAYTVEPPITDPPTSGQPQYNGHWPWQITIELVFNQPPTSGRFLIPDSGQAACSQLTNFNSTAGQTGNHTYLSCRNL